MEKTMVKINRAALKATSLKSAETLRDNAMNTTGRGYEIFLGDDEKLWVVPAKFINFLDTHGYERAL